MCVPPGPRLVQHRMPSLHSRQHAPAFNQPLSFDTSGVTNMRSMFDVRSCPRAPPQPTVGFSPARCVQLRSPAAS
eukprot:scaffold73363_cov60-Phaeocystis_antarctica.AAC.5